MTSSFDDWVNQDALALPPSRHSEWQTPLRIKPTSTAVAKSNAGPKEISQLATNQNARNSFLIYLTIFGTLCCLVILLVGVFIGRYHSSIVPQNKKTDTEEVVEKDYPQIASSANGDSFDGSHGKVLVRLNAMGNNYISIDCRSGAMIKATWRVYSMKNDGFEILSVDANTEKPGTDIETVLIVRETIQQYLDTKQQSSR